LKVFSFHFGKWGIKPCDDLNLKPAGEQLEGLLCIEWSGKPPPAAELEPRMNSLICNEDSIFWVGPYDIRIFIIASDTNDLKIAEGDRKAFYEASQWTIKQNKETLELLKEENKHFREALALLQKVCSI
jgi:hypothetical protein